MAWPLSQDYNEAVQNPSSSFADAELCGGEPVLNAMGMPQPRSGNFADVYEFKGVSGARWAVKCFTREVPGLRERYAEISKFLLQAKLPFTVDFKYLDHGLRIRGQWYPVLKMQWVDGFLLNEFIRCNLDKPALLDGLGQIWVRMGRRLRDAGMAHADLQHGNVILIPGSRSSALAVRLIDYDGMYVPRLANKDSGEVGHPSYQHPERVKQRIFSAEVDRLPLLAIACGLRCLTVGGQTLWDRHDNGDNLLFREKDLQKPGESALFQELWNLRDANAHDLVGYLTLGLTGAPEGVPLLHEITTDNKQTRPLTAVQEKEVTSLLGPGARVTRVNVTASPPKATAVRRGAAPSPSAWEALDDDEPHRVRTKDIRRKAGLLPWLIAASVLGVATLGGAGFLLFKKSDAGKQIADVPPKPPVPKKKPLAEKEHDPVPPAKPVVENQVATPVATASPSTPPDPRDWILANAGFNMDSSLTIQPKGSIASKKQYGPLEITATVRSRDGRVNLQVLNGGHSFPLPDSENWHQLRFVFTEQAVETWVDNRLMKGKPPASIRPGTVRFYTSPTGSLEIKFIAIKSLGGTSPDAPPVIASNGAGKLLGANEFRLYGAESQGDSIRIAPGGRLETKSKYAGPVEVSFEARCEKAMAVGIRQQTFGFSLPDKANWHKVRLLPVANAIQVWLDDRQISGGPQTAGSPGTIRVLSPDGVTEIKSFSVKPATDAPAVVAARDSAGLRVPEEILCSDPPRQYQIGKNFRIDKDWSLFLNYWASNQGRRQRILFAWGDGAFGKDPILLKQTGRNVALWLQGSGFNVNLPPDAMETWIPIRFEYKPSSQQVSLQVGTAKNSWKRQEWLPFMEPGAAWVGGIAMRPGYAGKIRNLVLENTRPAAIAAKRNPPPGLAKKPAAKRDLLPVPTAKAIAAADKQLRQLYANLIGKSDFNSRRQLMDIYLEQAKSAEDPAIRYACALGARDLAIDQRRYDAAFDTVQQLGEDFAVNLPQEMLKLLETTVRLQRNTFNDKEILQLMLKVIDVVKKQDAFTQISKLTTAGNVLVLRNPKDRSFTTILEDRIKLLRKVEKEFKKVKEARKTLESDPQDPKASKLVGRYCAFIKEDWQKGLPLLANGGDDALVAAAKRDLENVAGPQAQIDLGDAWLALADRETDLAKTNIQKRAKHWFLLAYRSSPDDAKANLADRLKLPYVGGVLKPGIKGEFFQGGKLLKRRLDYRLKFAPDFMAVDPELPQKNFSAKWQGFIWVPQMENYIFRVRCGGTFDIKLDYKQLLDSARATNITTSRLLTEGLHPIEINFQNLGNEATFDFVWHPSRLSIVRGEDDGGGLFYHFAKAGPARTK